MKKVLGIVAVLLVVLLAAAVAVPFLIPAETYKAQISRQVHDATGRELTIAGDVSLSILPRTVLTAEDAALANAGWAEEPQMAELARLHARVNPWALLSGTLDVESFVLERPRIHLAVDEQGRANWDFAPSEEPGEPAPGAPEVEPAPEAERERRDPFLADVGLRDVRIVDGTITYTDAASATQERFDDVNLSLRLEALDAPLEAEGSLVWNDETVRLVLRTGPPRGLLAGEPTRIAVDIESRPVALDFDGEVVQAAARRLDGRVAIEVPSLKDLAAWLGEPVEAGDGALEVFTLSGDLSAEDEVYAFTADSLRLDDITGEGALSADLSGAKPRLAGRLDLARLDLTPYLPEVTETAERRPENDEEVDVANGGETTQWSEEPIDVSALRLVDLDFELSVEAIRARDVEVGRSALALNIDDGLLQAELTELALYDGRGSGRVVVDAREDVPRIENRFSLEDVRAKPLLSDVADFERLEGRGVMEIDAAARGRSQRELVETLNGQGAISFRDGAVVGINMAAMVRNISSAFQEAGGTQKTDFAELAGTFTIEDGILRNDDLVLLNPLLRIRGQGTADIPRRSVDYRLVPRAVATLEGQGGTVEEQGVAVPVLVQGPWDDLRFRPDLESIVRDVVRDPGAMREQVEDTIKGVREGGREGLRGVLEGLTRGGETDEDDAGESGPADTLRQLFGN